MSKELNRREKFLLLFYSVVQFGFIILVIWIVLDLAEKVVRL